MATVRPPKTQPAALADLSQYARAVVYGRGEVVILRQGHEPFYVSAAEFERLALARAAFLEPQPGATG